MPADVHVHSPNKVARTCVLHMRSPRWQRSGQGQIVQCMAYPNPATTGHCHSVDFLYLDLYQPCKMCVCVCLMPAVHLHRRSKSSFLGCAGAKRAVPRKGGKLRVGMRKCVLIEEPLFVRLKLQAWTQPPHQSLLHDASSTASSTRGFYSRLISSSSYPPRPRGVFLGIFRRRAVGPEDFIVRFQYIK